MEFDLVIRNGTVATASDVFRADVGVRGGTIAALGAGLAPGRKEVDADSPARIYGLHPRKGTIAVGADADIALWDPARRVTVTNAMLHHNVDYTPSMRGWRSLAGRWRRSPRDDGLPRRCASGSAGVRRVPALWLPAPARPKGAPAPVLSF